MNRHFTTILVLLQGLALGLVAFAVAEVSLPLSMLDSTNHDMMLAQRLGLIYTPAVGAWLGWLQRSRSRALTGAIIGLGIGGIYFVLCMSQSFFAIMVGFPMLLGGGLAALAGSNRSVGVGAFFVRLGKGLVCRISSGLRLHVPSERHSRYILPPQRLFESHVYEMWKGGLPALGVASALFLVLMRWAVGLVRLRVEQA